MKITHQDAINIIYAIHILKSKHQLESKGIVFVRNKRLLKPIIEEYEEINQHIIDSWKESFEYNDGLYKTDAKYKAVADIAFDEYQTEHSDERDAFLKEEVEIDFFTFSEKEIEKESFDWEAFEVLEGKIILE